MASTRMGSRLPRIQSDASWLARQNPEQYTSQLHAGSVLSNSLRRPILFRCALASREHHFVS
jgi:hypothetical protein